jgi:hypothetical protein
MLEDQRQVGKVEQQLAAAREAGDAMPLAGDAVGIAHRQPPFSKMGKKKAARAAWNSVIS